MVNGFVWTPAVYAPRGTSAVTPRVAVFVELHVGKVLRMVDQCACGASCAVSAQFLPVKGKALAALNYSALRSTWVNRKS